jgi:hypothetical protein
MASAPVPLKVNHSRGMKSLAPVDPALPVTALLNSLSVLPVLLSIVPANTLSAGLSSGGLSGQYVF